MPAMSVIAGAPMNVGLGNDGAWTALSRTSPPARRSARILISACAISAMSLACFAHACIAIALSLMLLASSKRCAAAE